MPRATSSADSASGPRERARRRTWPSAKARSSCRPSSASRATAASTSPVSKPRRRSFRRSSAREWLRRAIRPTAAAKAPPGGASGLELLRGTSRGPDGRARLAGSHTPRSLLAHPGFDLGGQGRVLAQVVADVIATLAEAVVAVRHPGAALIEDAVLDRGVDQRALTRDAFVEQDVELGGPERRRDLVLDHLDLHPVADRIEAVLDDLDLADVEPHRRVELQGSA